MVEVISIQEGAARMERLARRLTPALEGEVGAVLAGVATDVRREIGALSLFRKPGHPPLEVEVSDVRTSGDEIQGAVEIGGMAAIVEEGGRTRPHTIRARGSLLRFEGKSGSVFTESVRHPGSKFEKLGSAERALKKADPGPVLDRAIQGVIGRVGLA